MSLRLITGRSGSGKTYFIQEEIANELKKDPLGNPVFVIVPDQMSFSFEHNLSVNYGLNGMMRAQVSTFKRLAWRILQETGGITRKEVDGFGYRMLVRSVLEENQGQFKLFRRAARKQGFTEQVEILLKEFSRYSLNFEEMTHLQQTLEEAKAPRTLLDKMSDLSLLLTKIEERLGTSYVDSEGHLALLVSQIEHSNLIKKADIYIDGFEGFTTREYDIITELMKYGHRVTVVLPMEADFSLDSEHELFFNSVRTANRLREIAREQAVDIEESVHFATGQRFKNEDLKHLEAVFDNYPAPSKKSEGNVEIFEAADPRSEIHAVARAIRQQVMKGKRYKDIVILYRQPEKYDELLETIFPHYDIPVFISRKKKMLHHPLIEFSRSVLEIVTSGWSYESIFRAVKTDLFFPHGEDQLLWRERADRLENFVLARGIYGSRWFDEDRWKVKKYQGLEMYTEVQTDGELALENEIHAVRDLVRVPLQKLEKKLKKAKTGRDVVEALFVFMESLQVYEKIIDLRADEERAGHLVRAAEHEQAWTEWIHVLDQFALMFGEKKMSSSEIVKILDEGFESLQFKQIPPALDQVTVSTAENSSVIEIDIVFVIGVNDGVFPQRIDHEGILSDMDRELFMDAGIELAPTSKMSLMDESFVAYRAFTSPCETLYLSYATADEEGKSLLPSLYIKRVQQVLTDTPIVEAVVDPSELKDAKEKDAYISHPRTVLSFVATALQQAKTEGQLSPVWQAVLSYYEKDPYWSSVIGKIQRPLEKGNESERLTPELTEELYGKTFHSSVSRVESYYSCPFQHYAAFGLKLGERAEYTLGAPAIGDLFHAALKWVSDEIMRLGKSWNDLTREDCWKLAAGAVDNLTPYFFNRILLSSSRYLYIKRKLQQIIKQTIYSLRSQAAATLFKTVAVETGFGPGETLPSLNIPLNRGDSMKLRGRIDRIDATEIKGEKYVRVVDYKSSERQLDLAEVYYGLSLQTITYLDVVLEYAEELLGFYAHPAGLLYMHVHNPMIRSEKELSPEKLEAEILKQYKMTGYVLENPDVVTGMDENIGQTSIIVPAGLRNDGSFRKDAKVLSPDDLQMMRTYVRRRHQLAGNAMIAGDTRVYPYELADKMPCQFCEYRSVCQFDPTNPEQKIRKYESMKPEESLERMRKEVSKDEHSSNA